MQGLMRAAGGAAGGCPLVVPPPVRSVRQRLAECRRHGKADWRPGPKPQRQLYYKGLLVPDGLYRRGVHPKSPYMEGQLQYAYYRKQVLDWRRRRRALREGAEQPEGSREQAVARYKHGSKRADGARHVRDGLRSFLDEVGGPYSREDLVDLYNNPQVDAEHRPPRALMEAYFNEERKRHLDIRPDDLMSRRERRRRMRPSQSALRRIDDDRHCDRETVQLLPWQKTYWFTRRRVAPVRMASTKAKMLFGVKSFVRLLKVAASAAEFPPANRDLPEVLVLGRANVGKSTLVNALLNRPVVDTSKRAGETSAAIWVQCGMSQKGNLAIVDTPGMMRGVELGSAARELERLLADAVALRARARVLKGALVLVDSQGGLGQMEVDRIQQLEEYEVPFYLVFTKSDLRRRQAMSVVLTETEEEAKAWPHCRGILVVTAAHHKGLNKLQTVVAEFAKIPELGQVTNYGFQIGDILPEHVDEASKGRKDRFDFGAILPARGLERGIEQREEAAALPYRVRQWRRFYRVRADKRRQAKTGARAKTGEDAPPAEPRAAREPADCSDLPLEFDQPGSSGGRRRRPLAEGGGAAPGVEERAAPPRQRRLRIAKGAAARPGVFYSRMRMDPPKQVLAEMALPRAKMGEQQSDRAAAWSVQRSF